MSIGRILACVLTLSLCLAVGSGCGPSISEPSGPEAPSERPNDDKTEQDKPSADRTNELVFSDSLREEYVNWYGRVRADGEKTDFSNSASGFEVTFTGTRLTATVVSAESAAPNEARGNAYAYVFTDGETNYHRAEKIEFNNTGEPTEYVLADLPSGEHTVRLIKCTEPKYGTASLVSLKTDGGFLAPPAKPSLKFELLGDSIMSGSECMRGGAGADSMLTESENSLASYGYIAASRLKGQIQAITRSGALVSGYKGFPDIPRYYDSYSQIDDTPWDFSRYQPDVIVLDLGTNDRNIAAPDDLIKETYLNFLRHLRQKNPSAAIICCEGAMLDNLAALTREIVQTANAEGDGKVWYFHLPIQQTLGHPTEQDHYENGVALARFLRETLDLFA